MNEEVFRQRAKKRLLALLIVFVAVAVVFLYFSRSAQRTQIASIESAAGNAVVKEVQRSVSNPAPLIATGTNSAASSAGANANTLTNPGIIADTNVERRKNGDLAALSDNVLLDQIALERLADMATKQYFAHVSPASSSAETVAKADGYDYIAIGENLALGNFAGDAGVVAAWMASPGHRANILNTHYTEIGVAAKDVIFDGQETWLAVQIFGRPASDCPAPNVSMKSSIDAAETQLTTMENSLSAQEAAIEGMSPSSPAYNGAVSSYDALAAQYNALLGTTKSDIATYNAQVDAYNTCLGI